MNIFVLDTDHRKCALYHCDQHIHKMIVEAKQIVTRDYPHHPCTLWVHEKEANLAWLRRHALALCSEFEARYHHPHSLVDWWLGVRAEDGEITKQPQCMPSQFRDRNIVTAYRAYYRTKTFAIWRHCGRPYWM